jgi:hypothetical protein
MLEVVRLFVNKTVVSAGPRRRGNPGYGRLKALRVLVYARFRGLENDKRIVTGFHNKNNPQKNPKLCTHLIIHRKRKKDS